MKRDVSSAGAVRYRLVVAALLMGSLAGCGVSSRTQPQPQDSALPPILVPERAAQRTDHSGECRPRGAGGRGGRPRSAAHVGQRAGWSRAGCWHTARYLLTRRADAGTATLFWSTSPSVCELLARWPAAGCLCHVSSAPSAHLALGYCRQPRSSRDRAEAMSWR